jgi:nitrite reductase (NADH) small subunit
MQSSTFPDETTPAGDPTWIRVVDLNECPDSSVFSVRVQEKDVAIFRNGNSYIAMDRWCPHLQGDLGAGCIIGKAVKCPLHGFMFSVDTGRGLNCPGFNVNLYQVRVDENILSVRMVV